MQRLSSLTNRLFLAMALLAVLSIGAATYFATLAVTARAEAELRRGLDEAGTLVEEYRRLLLDHYGREAALVADLPLIKAAVELNDPPTMQPVAERFARQLNAGLLLVTNTRNQPLARVARDDQRGVLQQVTVPISIDNTRLGALTVGFWLDTETATRFRQLTNSEIAFGAGGRIQTSTLPEAEWPKLAALLATEGVTPSLPAAGHDYIAATRTLRPLDEPAQGTLAPAAAGRAIILRSRTDRLRFLGSLHRRVVAVAIAAVLAATLVSYAIARTVTRPLRAVVAVMRETGSTGDLTRRIDIPAGAPWEDEDARLLATSFNTMTDSIARFQREAAQRERLSALGRLSTVVAHEIRNPLMIIKTALRGLRGAEVPRERVQEAVADIDGEVARLNRIVAEVLDFARPIKFDLQPVDLNALCADAARASGAETAGGVRLSLADALPPVVTDGERLRLALINVLTNAREAVAAAGPAAAGAIVLETSAHPQGAVAIEVRDRGIGIATEDVARIFDPFFTTRKTGTGLGLALTRNIIDGLGGSIAVSSAPGRGTSVRIELPAAAAPV